MGWWFGRKSAPADARPFVPAWLTSESAEEGFARSYEAQYDEVYRKNPVGQRAVRLVAGMLGALPVYAAEGDAAAARLASAGGLLERLGAHLLLHGNAYVQLIADEKDAPGASCACCGPSGSAWSATSAAGRPVICTAPAGRRCGSRARTGSGGGKSRMSAH